MDYDKLKNDVFVYTYAQIYAPSRSTIKKKICDIMYSRVGGIFVVIAIQPARTIPWNSMRPINSIGC